MYTRWGQNLLKAALRYQLLEKEAAVEAGYAAIQGEKDKYDNYKELVNDNYYVVPIAHETMGSLKQQVKNVPNLSCSKVWAWIYKEEMPYV